MTNEQIEKLKSVLDVEDMSYVNKIRDRMKLYAFLFMASIVLNITLFWAWQDMKRIADLALGL